MPPLRIFIGYDSRERAAYHVLAESIIRNASIPVAITPVGNSTLESSLWWRAKGEHDSTEFSNSRFAVPALAGYQGYAIFMDCDMLCLGDIAELLPQFDRDIAVSVVQHQHKPQIKTKFLGAEQAAYERKNWSSFMLMNCGHPAMRALSPEYINSAPGLDLHRLTWLEDHLIGKVRGLWNVLVGDRWTGHPELGQDQDIVPLLYAGAMKLLHFTDGGPWHAVRTIGGNVWMSALSAMLAGDNPRATSNWALGETRAQIRVQYEEKPSGQVVEEETGEGRQAVLNAP